MGGQDWSSRSESSPLNLSSKLKNALGGIGGFGGAQVSQSVGEPTHQRHKFLRTPTLLLQAMEGCCDFSPAPKGGADGPGGMEVQVGL